MRKTVQIEENIKKEFPELELSDNTIARLETYLELLSQWNTKINLTAIRDRDAMIVKHVLDSLVVFHIPQLNELKLFDSTKVLDFGSGAGIPGILLAICHPKMELTSVDKSRKKIAFQDQVVRQLKLDNVKPVPDRLEALALLPENKLTYDLIISRAFDQIKNILYFGQFFLKPEGYLLLWKGEKWEAEMEQVESSLLHLYEIRIVQRYEFRDFQHGGVILLIQKRSS